MPIWTDREGLTRNTRTTRHSQPAIQPSGRERGRRHGKGAGALTAADAKVNLAASTSGNGRKRNAEGCWTIR